MALDLAKRGASVVITYISASSEAKVDRLLENIEALGNGSRATSVRVDLRSLEAPETIMQAAKQFADGKAGESFIDILVNNAAAELNKAMENITVDDYTSIYDLNVRAPMLLTQAVLPHLRRPGRIINISSVGGRCGFANLSMYCSSKAALEGLTRCWAAELGKDGTTVNAVAPGPVESEMLANIPKEIVDIQKAGTPVGKRVGTADEIANVVSWLASADSAWMSGQVLNASGGWTMY